MDLKGRLDIVVDSLDVQSNIVLGSFDVIPDLRLEKLQLVDFLCRN